MKNDFYVVLPSNSCPLTQPDNTASHFIVDYINSIQLSGPLNKWQVALTEFICTYSALRNEEVSIIRYKKFEKSNSFHFSFYMDRGVIKYPNNIEGLNIRLTNERYFLMSYIKPFTVMFHSCAKLIGFENKYNKSTSFEFIHFPTDHCIYGKREIQMDSCLINGDVIVGGYCNDVVKFPKNVIFNNPTELCEYVEKYFSTLFKRMKIDGIRFLKFLLADNIIEIEIDETIAMFLGFSVTSFSNQGRWFVGDKRPSLKVANSDMYIFANIIEPIYIGNQTLPLLKHICFENKYKYGDVVYFSLKELMYVPVGSVNINKIEINIKDENGKLISFSKGSKTSLTLHFRKI